MSSSTSQIQTTTRARFAGARIVYTAIAVFGAMCALLYLQGALVQGSAEEGARLAIRATARTTAALFVVIFCASGVRRRWPGPATGWLMRNRRHLGLSAAVSHAYHLAFILALYAIGTAEQTPAAVVAGGSFGFLMLFLMAATSNDASQRRLRRNWRRLHLLGMWTLWIIFAFSYFPRAPSGVIGALASVALVVSLLLRVWPVAKPGTKTA